MVCVPHIVNIMNILYRRMVCILQSSNLVNDTHTTVADSMTRNSCFHILIILIKLYSNIVYSCLSFCVFNIWISYLSKYIIFGKIDWSMHEVRHWKLEWKQKWNNNFDIEHCTHYTMLTLIWIYINITFSNLNSFVTMAINMLMWCSYILHVFVCVYLINDLQIANTDWMGQPYFIGIVILWPQINHSSIRKMFRRCMCV